MSQSPLEVPTDQASADQNRQYLLGWKALGHLLSSGRSFSGHEKNCCYLNLGGETFADVSAVTGYNRPDDGRGAGYVDWDFDGDLDAWAVNRTAPRVRLLRNDTSADNGFLSLRLQGTASNRDAIGARAEVALDGEVGTKLLRTVRAGQGYLSQSSKWLHFGLGASAAIKSVSIRWPNGTREEFAGAHANGRFTLVQGTGQAVRWEAPPPSAVLEVKEQEPPVPAAASRIVLPARLPLPRLRFQTFDSATSELIGKPGQPLLLNLWASWCQPCLVEFKEWSANYGELKNSDLTILSLSVELADGTTDATETDVKAAFQQLGLPWEGGTANTELLERLDMIQRLLTNHRTEIPIPCSFLIDGNGDLAVVYKGPVSSRQLRDDIASLATPRERVRDLAVPFRGRWYLNPMPADVAALPDEFLKLGQWSDAFEYLHQHLATRTAATERFGTLPDTIAARVGQLHYSVAGQDAAAGQWSQALLSYRAALDWQPGHWDTQTRLAIVLVQLGNDLEAVRIYRNMLASQPEHAGVKNNLAWLLATSRSETVSDPEEAMKLATDICRETGFTEPVYLSTLAAAQFAAGLTEEAAATIQTAIPIAEEQGQDELIQRLRLRLDEYSRAGE